MREEENERRRKREEKGGLVNKIDEEAMQGLVMLVQLQGSPIGNTISQKRQILCK